MRRNGGIFFWGKRRVSWDYQTPQGSREFDENLTDVGVWRGRVKKDKKEKERILGKEGE